MDISIASLKGGSLLVGWGKKTYRTGPDPKQPSWYSPDFFLENETPWHTHEHAQVLPGLNFSRSAIKAGKPLPFDAMYRDMTLKKGVVYTSLPLIDFDWQSALAYLLDRGRKYMIYGTEGILGATPELLFDIAEGRVETMALASTAEKPEDLQREKEQEEHQIVVRGIEEALAPYGKVVKEPVEIVPFGTLFHLRTRLTLLASPPFEALVKALHPTPALGAWPKNEGMAWLKKWNEKVPRAKYGAPFGYVYPAKNEARAFVAIRCVQWDKNGAALWAGCGVTPQSLFEKEWEEVLNKFQNTAHLFGIELGHIS